MSEYFALDVETANASAASICQIGIVHFRDHQVVDEWASQINPLTFFDPYNVSIHGIDETDVAKSPSLAAIYPQLEGILSGGFVVHHGHFDRTAFTSAYEIYGLEPLKSEWIDNTKVVRRTWEQFSKKGYGLANLVKHFEIPLDHHDALSDARAAGKIFALASEHTGNSVEQWLEVVNSRSTISGLKKRIAVDGVEGALFNGETLVFTGSLREVRAVAAEAAGLLGFNVRDTVTADTTFLVVGTQDADKLGGYNKSSKHRKAESLAGKGQEISILTEEDFWALVKAKRKSR
ncbi:exonuclease domain-containing protein [Tabrizicola sp.]|uniref:exonuclease domain-containing protein n=1 Tax=Tabrizicola sp. TaxID=2005166 RepID=UPI00273397D1|nr:exonuclease domain-containing protein [Tabrizicola sp.]MDP3197283.1 exonuclease domain-containing protein [Tabrizicola sp.]